MSDFFIDTSYVKKYVVVHSDSHEVVLRPIETDSINSYWKEFISGYIDTPTPDIEPILRLTQIPPEVISVNAYTDYSIEYPRVEVQFGETSIDISDSVSVNHPSYETPGLYALDFMVPTFDGKPEPIWRSWVSIEEAPLFRKVITPWNRSNKSIADLNRLVIEPQFNEALYAAGVPIYNFQQANANVAVNQFAVQRYKDARAFVKESRLFISGPVLPVGTSVTIKVTDGTTINRYTRLLREPITCAPFYSDMPYFKGDVVSYCGSSYYALDDVTPNGESSLPTSTYVDGNMQKSYWLQGTYYIMDSIDVPNGEYELCSLWAAIDVSGYLFKMDLLRAFKVQHYWGHYDKKNFYDYAPGDLVSIVSNNVISLYQRNDTGIDEIGLEESYRPGHYKNPHWTEVYSESNDVEITNPIIKPYTNSANAVISKTYSAKEESFRMYANMVGIPRELVDLLGSKYSVILWALLYRTRETFPGIKAAFRAAGLDLMNLRREHPSIIYQDSSGQDISSIYNEIDIVKNIARSVECDRVWSFENGTTPEIDDSVDYDMPPWIAYKDDGNTVLIYNNTTESWEPYYSFRHIGSDLEISNSDFTVNNRYYRAELNLLDRLSKDGALDLGDGIQWIEPNYFAAISNALARLLDYEIPIYIYFKLKVHLASIGHSRMCGTSNVAIFNEAWGGFIGLKVYPGKIFNIATCTTDYYYPTVLYSYEYPGSDSDDIEWLTYTNPSDLMGYRYYSFDQPVYVRLFYPPGSSSGMFKANGMWTSRFTIGCLGDWESKGTDDYESTGIEGEFQGFKDASMMANAIDDRHSPDMYLCKGMAGCTLKLSTGSIDVTAECLQWNYIFDDPAWKMDESLKFADWKLLEGTKFIGFWDGGSAALKDSISLCTSPDLADFKYTWGDEATPTLYVGGGVPNNVYMYDSLGYLKGIISIPYVDNMVLNDNTDYLVKISFL